MDCPACGSPVTLEIGPDRPLSTSLSDAVLAAEEDERIEVTRDCWDCGWPETRALHVASIDTTAGDGTAVERAALIDEITDELAAIGRGQVEWECDGVQFKTVVVDGVTPASTLRRLRLRRAGRPKTRPGVALGASRSPSQGGSSVVVPIRCN